LWIKETKADHRFHPFKTSKEI